MASRNAPARTERGETCAYRNFEVSRRDRRVSELAAKSESVLDVDELASCGLTIYSICRRERAGHLHRLHHGVYAVGHPNVSLKGRFLAAVKACKPDAALSHRSEAARAGIRPWTERDIEVTTRAGTSRRHEGIEVHRSSLMSRRDLMERDGMLVTNATWTVVALAAVLPKNELRSAVREALNLELVSIQGILALLERLGPVRGARNLRDILARALPTRSELEDIVYDLIVAGGFVPPEVNKPLRLDGHIVIPDFRWPQQKLVVEADGARWHAGALARADDLERQRLLERHGETVVRIRWNQAIARGPETRKRLELAGAPLLEAPKEVKLAHGASFTSLGGKFRGGSA